MEVSTKLLVGPKKGAKYKRWVKPFLQSLRKTCSIAQSVENLKGKLGQVSEMRVYQKMQECPVFRAAVEKCKASAIDVALAAAYRRGVQGWDTLITHQGQACFVYLDENNTVVPPGTDGARAVPLTKRLYSDACLLEILRKKHPEFKDSPSSSVSVNVTNNSTVLNLSMEELAKLPPDELVRIHRETLGLSSQ